MSHTECSPSPLLKEPRMFDLFHVCREVWPRPREKPGQVPPCRGARPALELWEQSGRQARQTAPLWTE